jgi:hypothetical protein
MKTLAIPTILLATSAIVLGQLSARAEDGRRGGRGGSGGEGGIAGASTDCATAPDALPGANPFDTSGATTDLLIPDGAVCGTHMIYKAVYFRFTATLNGPHIFETCGAEGWDTRIAIMNACDPAAGVLNCDDDGCSGTYRSRMGASLVAGTTYIVAIGAYWANDGGLGTLTITEPSGGGGGGGKEAPDVIVGALPDIAKYGSVVVNGQTIMAYAFGTTSCNIGTAQLSWYGAPDNRHPFIPTNMFRYRGGRFEQIGMSWGKHGFCALQENLCGTCIPAAGGCPPILGIGCSDPYSAGLSGDQGGLGTRKEVNAATGGFPGSYNVGMPAAPVTIGRRLQVAANDLNPTQNAGARYLIEGQYIHPEDAAAGNDDNNASWRQFTVGTLTGGAYNLTYSGATNQQQPAIEAWRAFDTAVSIVTCDVPNDGRFLAGYRVKDNGNGTWRYEYAIQNLNSDRSGRSLRIPVPSGVTITNAGFKDINYHSGDPFDPTDWSISTSGGAIEWTGGTYSVSPNGNALRFATLYNFWFDANTAPTTASASLGLFKPGAPSDPSSMPLMLAAPAARANPADLNGDGAVSGADLSLLLTNWGGSTIGDIDGDGSVGAADLALLLAAWS